MDIATPEQHRDLAIRYGQSPETHRLVLLAHVLWAQGFPDQALQWGQKALVIAQDMAHIYSSVQVLYQLARLHFTRGEVQATQEQTEALLALAREHGLAQWTAAGTVYQGWLMAVQGQSDAGLARMRQGIDAMSSAGGAIFQPVFLTMLSGVYVQEGEVEEGLRTLTNAFAFVHQNGQRYLDAELHRLRGELYLQQRPAEPDQAEACFHQALDITRRQNTKSWELQAAISLSRLWQQQDRLSEAQQLLSEVYGEFTEGFDTADLQAAAALLETLTT